MVKNGNCCMTVDIPVHVYFDKENSCVKPTAIDE